MERKLNHDYNEYEAHLMFWEGFPEILEKYP